MDVLAMPVFTDEPTGPMCRLLRRILGGTALKAIRIGPARVLCIVDGHEADKRVVAGLLTRGLIREAASDDDSTTYTLTTAGERWAQLTTGGN